MVKILRVDDDVHTIITKLASAEDRKITPYLNRHFRELGGTPKISEPQNPTDILHDKVIPAPLYPEKNNSRATPEPSDKVSDLFTKSNLPDNMQVELPCCANEFQPCKHWVWDAATGDGYKNSLSGRFMEVE